MSTQMLDINMTFLVIRYLIESIDNMDKLTEYDAAEIAISTINAVIVHHNEAVDKRAEIGIYFLDRSNFDWTERQEDFLALLDRNTRYAYLTLGSLFMLMLYAYNMKTT